MRLLPTATRSLCLLLALAAGSLAVAGPEDEAALERRLGDAQYLERTKGEYAAALAVYEEVLEHPGLPARFKGRALLGAAVCREAQGDAAGAMTLWDRVLGDASMPQDVRDQAQQAKASRKALVSKEEEQKALREAAERALAARREEAHRRAVEHLQRARAALAERNFETARVEAYRALELDEDNAEARELLLLIEEQSPDRGELIRDLMNFFESLQSQEFQRLKSKVGDLWADGHRLHTKGDLVGADRAFRDAVRLIDGSEFRRELEEDRDNLAIWLGITHDAGKSKGIALDQAPLPPLEGAPAPSLKGRFFALLEEAFSTREGGTDPLRFYEMAPAPIVDRQPHRFLGPNQFPPGVAVEQSASALTRARWAERWIRANLGTGWAASSERPAPRAARPPAPGARAPLLERFGDVLFLQHKEAVQREVAELRGAFAARPPPFQVDVAVYAAGRGAAVRAATALHVAPAGSRESGLDPLVPGRLLEECRRDLQLVENLQLLGTAQVNFDGDVAATLEVTERTERHALYQNLPPPELTIPGADLERYGLFLDLYAEDLPGAKRGTPRSGALSVAARTLLPQPSFVVRKNDRRGEWTRLPRMAERIVESDRTVAHASTLVLLGLSNPFAGTAETHPDLVVLVGIRPGASEGRVAPVPDVPATPPIEASAERQEAREYVIGPLATEVLDASVKDGWPEQHSASAPTPEGTQRQSHQDHLADWIARRARLKAPGQADAPARVAIREHVLSASLSPEEQVRVDEAVTLLTSQEASLYEVGVLAVEAPARQVEAWARLEGVSQISPGSWLVGAPAAAALDAPMRALADPANLYGFQGEVPARATQQVVMLNLRSHSFVRDLRVTRSADGRQRYRFLPGVAEEGLVLEVRPGLEEDGRTVVTARARAARLKAIESVRPEGVEQKAAAVQVPSYHPVSDRSTGSPLNDREALLLVLDVPAVKGRVIAVKITVKRVQ